MDMAVHIDFRAAFDLMGSDRHSNHVFAAGQDGPIANVAKYLDGQPVLGVNPAPDQFDGVLLPVCSRTSRATRRRR